MTDGQEKTFSHLSQRIPLRGISITVSEPLAPQMGHAAGGAPRGCPVTFEGGFAGLTGAFAGGFAAPASALATFGGPGGLPGFGDVLGGTVGFLGFGGGFGSFSSAASSAWVLTAAAVAALADARASASAR